MKVVVLFIIGPKDVQITMFRATMLVMRAEDWWVKAESFEKAEALAAGQGHRAALGELVVELEAVRSDDDRFIWSLGHELRRPCWHQYGC
jgi:hypothetical protein